MELPVYLSGTDVTLIVPMVDKYGNALDVTEVDYRVLDELENELVPRTTVTPFVAGSPTITLLIPASCNTLDPTTDTRKARTVQMFVVVGSNTFFIDSSYGLEIEGPLSMGLNSFQTYAQAIMTAMDVPNTPNWDAAGIDDRMAALIDARNHLCKLSYSLLNSNANYSQDQLAYIPEGAYESQYIENNSLFLFTGNLELLSPAQIQAMPARFIRALQLAQVAEADSILTQDSTLMRRQQGLILDSVGDSKQMYRAAKPLQLPICARALAYVSYFITFAKQVGRG